MLGIDAQALSRPAHWLLDLEVGGTVYRFADTDLEVDEGSLTHLYASGLSDLEITIGEGPTVTRFEIEPYAGGVSWALLVARGASLSAATVTIRRWCEGQDRAAALVVVRGRLVSPEYGADDEPLSGGVDSTRWDSTGTVPSSTAVIDPTTWPITTTPYALAVDPDALGAVYPRPYGYPGRETSLLWGSIPLDSQACPAYIGEYGGGAHTYDSSQLVIADKPIGATTVKLLDATCGYSRDGTTTSETVAVSTAIDLRGREVAVIKASDLTGNVHIVPGNEYWYTIPSDGLGGVLDPETGLVMRRAGAIIEDLLKDAGVPYDRGRFAAARAQLDRIELDFCLKEAVRPEDWVPDALGSLVPILRREGPEGLWYELWRYDAAPADAEAHLVGDDTVVRTTPLRWGDASEVENDFTLKYLKTRTDFAKSIRLVGSETPDTAAKEQGSLICGVSQATYGRREVVLESELLGEDAAAALVLQIRAQWKAFTRRICVVQGGPELGTLGPNTVVTYTEAGLHLDRALALVKEITLRLETTALLLELLDRPDRRGRAATATGA
jgi:hypothetical protein